MNDSRIKLVLPTGRMQDVVLTLLADAGIKIKARPSDYRPAVSDDRFEIKMLKAANIPSLLEYGAHDVGFSGRDWVEESGANTVTLLDTGLLPVRIASSAPRNVNPFAPTNRPFVVVASEYENITRRYMESKDVDYRFVRTFGATEVFPPEDADLIVDNVATGRTLRANGLEVVDEIMTSSTLLVANEEAVNDPMRGAVIAELKLLVQSVLDARTRVLLDMNVSKEKLDTVVSILPSMKSPTIQPLIGNNAFAVRAAVPKADANRLLTTLREAGASDILQTEIQRLMP